MIRTWLLSGDKHRNFNNILTIAKMDYKPEETAIIILGDCGADYYLNESDRKFKNALQETGFTFYFLRGNHEERPALVEGMTIEFDGEVNNDVYVHPSWPQIRYFIDGQIYLIDGYTCLTIGGAYSVDKYYRQAQGWQWFPGEQLTKEEMNIIEKSIEGIHVDFVFTHTCPLTYEPRDLFLSVVDQSTVDKSMEEWLDRIEDKFRWFIWLFGHYHADRLVRPNMEMMYHTFDTIQDIYERHYTMNYRYIPKDPNFYMDDCRYHWRLEEKEE